MTWKAETRGVNTGISHAIARSQLPMSNWGMHAYMNNYARGGIASHMFEHPDIKIQRGLFGGTVRPGSRAYQNNLDAIRRYQESKGIALTSAQHGPQSPQAAKRLKLEQQWNKGPTPFSARGLARSGVMSAAFIGLAPAMTPGGPREKMRATAGSAGATAAYLASTKVGASGAIVGGKIGTAVLPGVGTAVGALAGGLIGMYITSTVGWKMGETIFDSVDAISQRAKRRRQDNWIGDTTAFHTERAATMRQASLQMMNTGHMTARSALGQEGIMCHQ